MAKTLLESFIERKVNEHMEPSRRGKLKRKPIGFSRKKYMATLCLLTSDKEITIAMEQGLSYGLLRKWKTEEPFRTMIGKHCKEFADTFIKHVSVQSAEKRKAIREYLIGSPGSPLPRQNDDAFRDSSDYSPVLLSEILHTVVDHARKAEKERSSSEAFAVLFSFLSVIRPVMGEKAAKETEQNTGIDLSVLAGRLKLGAIGRVKEVLLKRHITEDEREEACYLLSELETIG